MARRAIALAAQLRELDSAWEKMSTELSDAVALAAGGECTALKRLDLSGCSGLVSLPVGLGECKRLQDLGDLRGCSGLLSLPDLSGLKQLEVNKWSLPGRLQPWASGYKALSLSKPA